MHRLGELEAMQKVEEEFQRKRAREKNFIQQQLRIASMEVDDEHDHMFMRNNNNNRRYEISKYFDDTIFFKLNIFPAHNMLKIMILTVTTKWTRELHTFTRLSKQKVQNLLRTNDDNLLTFDRNYHKFYTLNSYFTTIYSEWNIRY